MGKICNVENLPTSGGSSVDPYINTPSMDGVGSAGLSDAYSRGDHVHPSDTTKANQTELASEFNTASAYSIGDVVSHDGALYRFIANHAAGAWSASDVTLITVGDQIANYRTAIVTVASSAWSSTATGGYYTATVSTPAFSSAGGPNLSCGGVTITTPPTSEQVAAYRNIESPNGYAEQLSETSIKLYAKVKPTSTFYLKITGYGMGVQLDSCQNALQADQLSNNLNINLTGLNGQTYSLYNGSNTVAVNMYKKRYTVTASSWSASPNASGYYTYTLAIDSMSPQYGVDILYTGADASTRPTEAQITAYRNICEPNGYVDQTSATHLVMYAKVKPTTTFYIVVQGSNLV